jgi:hypothetical protein
MLHLTNYSRGYPLRFEGDSCSFFACFSPTTALPNFAQVSFWTKVDLVTSILSAPGTRRIVFFTESATFLGIHGLKVIRSTHDSVSRCT